MPGTLKLNSGGAGNLILTPSGSVGSDVTVTVPAVTGTAMVSANMPAFSAYSSSTQNPTSATYTKVVFGTEVFDTNSNFASSRFTPTVAGYYQLNASVSMAADSNISAGGIFFYKNGSLNAGITGFENTSLSGIGYQTLMTSSLVYLNGSTDYVEVYAFATGTGTNRYFFASAGDHPTTFNGAMVRAA